MNYIKEINAFHEEQLINPVSGKAMKLWFILMHINNKTGWKKTFTVAASVLCLNGKLSSSSFKRARTELRDKGYIQYKSRTGNQAASYEMQSLYRNYSSTDHHKNETIHKNNDQNSPTKQLILDHSPEDLPKRTTVSATTDQNQPNLTEDLDRNVSPLVKQKETKQRSSSADASVINFFEENFGKISPYIRSELTNWMNQSGQALVISAMKRALDRGKASWGYVKGILKDWKNKGIQTVEETAQELLSFQKQANHSHTKQTVEIIPDWFHERDMAKQKPKNETAEEKNDRMEVDRLLAAFS